MLLPPIRFASVRIPSTADLIVGTGKYSSYELMGLALDISGTECITVAVRRERLIDASGKNLLDFIDTGRYTILPNTAGCFTADDAVRVARLGREILAQMNNSGADWVKLEVLGDAKTLLPDPVATLEATEKLVADGFQVLVYTSDDAVVARRLKAGGGGQRHARRKSHRLGAGRAQPERHPHLPGVFEGRRSGLSRDRRCGRGNGQRRDGGHGTGRGRRALEYGHRPCQGSLPDGGGDAAGRRGRRLAWLSGRIAKKLYATASSPTEGTIAASRIR